MRTAAVLQRAVKSALAREWKPRAPETGPAIIPTKERHPERFVSQIVLSDGSSFRVRSTAPREQVKITKDTRSHPLWNPQAGRKIDDEGGYLSSFQKKFGGMDTDAFDFHFADDAEKAKTQTGNEAMAAKKAKK
ncbi:hypothetical protein LPJ61_006291 [Coemansia biformis]|uniref:Large ribosomal subunit protein bL31c n=1 Tax=Coemansia biformis TaxID=1286918 RepID=A0A9W7XV38_9FUNG|nr:hypothetical protein LPJ61_006291 [Coemansia biformis]